MSRRLPSGPGSWLAGVGALAAIAATMAIAAPSAAAAEKVYESETTAECVLAPGVLNEPGTLKLKVTGEGPASVKKGESFAAKNSTITITTPEAWGKLLFSLGARRIKGLVTVAEVEAENGSPAVLNIAKPPEFPSGLPIKTKVENAAVTFVVPSENRVFIAGPTTVTAAESGNLVVKYDPVAGFTKVGTGSYASTHKGIQSEVTGFTEAEPGEQVIGPLETSCTEPKATPIATVPIVPPAAPPTVTSVTPNEVGSAGNFKVIIKGTHFEEVSSVHYGTVPATKIITTGTPTKGQCKVKSSTELECFTPFHEHGKAHTTVTNASGTSTESSADEVTFWAEIYRNEVAVGTAHVTNLGYGQIQLESPQIQTTVECVNLGFGSAWNEANGGPTYGHGEISVWWASGHTPTAEHAELSSKCRFIYHNVEENQPTSPASWATAEPALKLVNQEGIVCTARDEALALGMPERIGTGARNGHARSLARRPERALEHPAHRKGRHPARAHRPARGMQGQGGCRTHRTHEVPRSLRTRTGQEPRRVQHPADARSSGVREGAAALEPAAQRAHGVRRLCRTARPELRTERPLALELGIRRSRQGRTEPASAGNPDDRRLDHRQREDPRLLRTGTDHGEVAARSVKARTPASCGP